MGKITHLLTSLAIADITLQTPYENLQGTPTALPSTEPGTNQIDYTIASGDLPLFSVTPDSKVFVAVMYAGGRDTGGNSTLYWRMLKNGSPVATGSISIFLNDYWTFHGSFYDVAVGDTLSLRFWRGAQAVNWDYEARQIQLSRVSFLEKHPLFWNFNIAAVNPHPVLTQGNPLVSLTNPYLIYGCDTSMSEILSSTKEINPWKAYTIHKLFRLYQGDYTTNNTGYVLTNAIYRPFYRRNYIPTQIKMRALRSLL